MWDCTRAALWCKAEKVQLQELICFCQVHLQHLQHLQLQQQLIANLVTLVEKKLQPLLSVKHRAQSLKRPFSLSFCLVFGMKTPCQGIYKQPHWRKCSLNCVGSTLICQNRENFKCSRFNKPKQAKATKITYFFLCKSRNVVNTNSTELGLLQTNWRCNAKDFLGMWTRWSPVWRQPWWCWWGWCKGILFGKLVYFSVWYFVIGIN